VLVGAARPAAQGPVIAAPAAQPELAAVAFDARDGTLWAAGRNYKMCFAGAAATYVPFFGSAAPRNFPLRLEVSEARVGGEALALRGGEPRLAGARVSVDRGAFTELFDLAPEQVEHSFRFDALAQRGELVLTLTIDSGLAMTARGDGVAFAGEFGRVDYTHAVVIDAAGARLPLAIEAEAVGVQQRGASLRLRVPAEFVANAKLPLLVDPVLTTVSVNTSTYSEHSADLAYLSGNTDYGVVFQREYSATDQDVWLQRMGHTGTKVGTPIAIDFTTERWSRPRIGSQRVGAKFLVVAEVQAASGTGATWIAGRICNNASGTVEPVIAIDKEGVAGHHSGSKRAPDVGGGLSLQQTQDFAVVWTRETAPGNRDVHCKRVNWDGTLGAATATVLAGGSDDEFAATISCSNGNVAEVYQRWAVVYTRARAGHDDVWAALLGLDAQPQLVNGAATFPLAVSASDDEAPVVSSPTDSLAGARHFLCAFSRRFANDNRIFGVVFDHSGVVRTTADLSLLDGSPAGFRYRPGSVDTDGVRFVVASSDGAAPGATKTAASLFAWDAGANVLMVHEARASLSPAGTARDLPQVFSMRNGGADGAIYGIVQHTAPFAGVKSVEFLRYFGGRSGGYATRATGCGGLQIATSNTPAIGTFIGFTLTPSSATSGALLGTPAAIPLPCSGCTLGIANAILVVGYLGFQIPSNPYLVGAQFSVQGFDVGLGNCFGSIALSNTVDVRIQ
jgi:hypothetical protein